jgi:hypothetical protein
MIVHIQRKGEKLDVSTSRVTFFNVPPLVYTLDAGPVLVLGTVPNLNVIAIRDIELFWVEED